MKETKPTRTVRRGRIFPEIQWTEEQETQWRSELNEFRKRCEMIFERVKPELIKTHYNWYIAIEPDSGDYFVGKTLEIPGQLCRDKYPDKIPHVFRINESGVCGTI
jgi:hypothetical protein